MGKLAKELGVRYSMEPRESLIPGMEQIETVRHADLYVIPESMSRKDGSGTWHIAHIKGIVITPGLRQRRRSQRTWYVTAVYLKRERNDLPSFLLGRESLFFRLKGLLVKDNYTDPVYRIPEKKGIITRVLDLIKERDINFSDSPEFSRRYRLRAGDEKEIRKLFTRKMRTFFENRKPGLFVECAGDRLFIGVDKVLLGPKKIRTLYNDALKILEFIRARQKYN